MISAFCKSIAISQQVMAGWLGLSRFTLARLVKKNEMGKTKGSKLLQLFLQEWRRAEKEPLPLPDVTSQALFIRLQIKRLELERLLLSKEKEDQENIKYEKQLQLRLSWIGHISQDPEIKKMASLRIKLEELSRQSIYEWNQLYGLGPDYLALEKKHLQEKIYHLQILENELKKEN